MIPLVKPYIPEYSKLFDKLAKVFDTGYISEGEDVIEFERKIKDLLNLNYSLAVNSGTSALHLALKLLDIHEGDEVISTALTAEPTNTVIKITGAEVIFADVDINTGLILAESIEKKINKNTKAIMIVHYAGMVCDLDKINLIAKKYNIPVIEDAAHAFMSKYNGKYIGSNSRFTVFSFQAIKHLTTIDGGLLALTNENDYIRAKKLRWFGLDKSVPRLENNILEAGYKYNMNNINASIGLLQIENIDYNVKKYIENGKKYDQLLSNVTDVELIKYYPNTEPSYWLYTLLVERRSDFIKKMREHGIEASPLHLRNDRHSVFKNLEKLPNLDRFYQKFVHIPCGWWVTNEDIIKIVTVIKNGW